MRNSKETRGIGVGDVLQIIVICGSLYGYQLISAAGSLMGIETSLSIFERSVVLGASLVLIFINFSKKIKIDNINLLLFLCFLLYGVRLFYETNYNYALLRESPSFYWIWYLGVTLAPSLAVATTPDLNVHLCTRVLVLILLAVAPLIALTGGTMEVSATGVVVDTGRLALESLNSISVGYVGAALTALGIWLSLFDSDIRPKFRLVAIAAAVLGLYIIIVAASRGPLVGMLISLILMIFSKKGSNRFWSIIALPIVLGPATMYIVSGEASILRRIDDLISGYDRSTSARIALYQEAVDIISGNPILGAYIEVPSLQYYPHNFFLEFAMATGIFSAALAIGVFVFLAYRAIVLIRFRRAEAPFAILYIQFLIGAQFSGAVYSNAQLWIAAVVVGLSRLPAESGKLVSQKNRAIGRRAPGALS